MLGATRSIRRSTGITALLLAGALTHLPGQHDSLAQAKSPGTALALSLGATTLPYAFFVATGSRDHYNGGGQAAALAVFTIFVGPAVGHFYAGQPGRALVGMGVRAGLAGATALLTQASCKDNSFETIGCEWGGVIIGGLALTAAMIVDIAAAPGSARKFNSEHAHLTIIPLQDGPHTRLGVGMQLRF